MLLTPKKEPGILAVNWLRFCESMHQNLLSLSCAPEVGHVWNFSISRTKRRVSLKPCHKLLPERTTVERFFHKFQIKSKDAADMNGSNLACYLQISK